jgi:HEAT repeat protein
MSHAGTKMQRKDKPRPRGEIELLVETLAREDGIERQCARERLVSIGNPAVPALIRCLSDPRHQVRWEAAKALGKIADPIAAPSLVGALEDKDFGVRWLAAVGLTSLGRNGLVPLFSALLERPDSDWLREGAHHVCHELAKRDACHVARPVLDALNTSEPELAVPAAAYAALQRLRGSD